MVFIVGDTRGGVLLSRLEEVAGRLGRAVSESRSCMQGGRSPHLRIQESPGKAVRASSRGQLSPLRRCFGIRLGYREDRSRHPSFGSI